MSCLHQLAWWVDTQQGLELVTEGGLGAVVIVVGRLRITAGHRNWPQQSHRADGEALRWGSRAWTHRPAPDVV